MIALEMTKKYIHIAEGKRQGRGVCVKAAVSVPVSGDAIMNGYMKDKGKIKEILAQAFSQHKMNTNKIVFVIDSTALKTKSVQIPYVPSEKVVQFLQREMGEILADEEYIIDYMIHDIISRENKKYMKCTVYAIPKVLLTQYKELAEDLHLKIQYIDILNNVIAKQIELDIPQSERQKHKKTDIPVKLWVGIYYDKLKFWTNGVGEQLFCKTVMIPQESETATNSDKELLIFCVKEIQNIIEFQKEILPGHPIEQIDIMGEHLMTEQIPQLIGKFIKVETGLWKRPKQIRTSDQEYFRYAAVIGSLLRR